MKLRRVVSGVDERGRATFAQDGPVPNVLTTESMPGVEMALVWSTDDLDQLPHSGAESTSLAQEFFPAPGGTRVMRIVYPPGFGASAADDGTAYTDTAEMLEAAQSGRLLMHQTDTIDYGIVLAGEICVALDSGEETTLEAGDMIVQNGVPHGWANRSDADVEILFVIVGVRRTPSTPKH